MTASGLYFLVVTFFVIPLASYRTSKRFDEIWGLMSRVAFFGQIIVLQLILLAFAIYVASANQIDLFPNAMPSIPHILVGVVALGLTAGSIPARWRFTSPSRRAKLIRLIPETRAERGLWIILSFVAGVSEEVVYRGVMFALVSRFVEDLWMAAIVCSVAFGLGHTVQGMKSAITIMLFAVGFHLIVRATGSLYVAMGIHFLYDLIAGFAYAQLSRGTPPGEATSD